MADFVRETSGAPLSQICPTHIERLSDWRDRLRPGQTVLGPGLEAPRIHRLIPAEYLPTTHVPNFPEGRALIGLVRDAWTSGQRDDPWTVEPNYLRKSGAEEKLTGTHP